MEKSAKISWGQLLLLLLTVRVFTLMTFVPLVADGYTPTTQLVASVISTAIQAVLLIPAVTLARKYGGSVTGLILEKSKVFGFITVILYLIFFLSYTVNAVLHFKRFISTRFFPAVNEYLLIGVFLLLCAYCAHLGIEGIARAAVILFAIFAVTLISVSITSAPSYDMLNLYYDESYKSNLFRAVSDDMARNGEIAALVFLSKHVKEKFTRASYGLLVSKLALSLTAALLIITVLGEFAALTDYPFLAVGSYSGVRFIQRADSVFLAVWTVTAVIAGALVLNIVGGLAKEILPKMRFCYMTAAFAVFAAVMFFTVTERDFSEIYQTACSAAAIAVLTFLIPFITLSVKYSERTKFEK